MHGEGADREKQAFRLDEPSAYRVTSHGLDRLAVSPSPIHEGVCTPLGLHIPPRTRQSPLPVLYPNRDFFVCDVLDFTLKGHGVSMEVPIFTLATQKDTSVWRWQSRDAKRSMVVTPSVLGRATQHDKDVIIYLVSQMTQALNEGRADAALRVLRFRVYDYLVGTNKRTGGVEYKRLQDALERLRGTSIKTNIKAGGRVVKEGFGLIDAWRIIERAPGNTRMVAVEVELSRWLFAAVQAREVLSLSMDYFRLRRPIERRLYELARKHCGDQARFVIGLELLQEKCGSRSSLREFRRVVRTVADADTLPGYHLVVLDEDDQVTIWSRGAALR